VNSATSTTDIGVGAHQAHLNPGPDPIAGPVACTECHVVPAALNYAEHPSPIPGPATMSFGPLARTAGANSAWDRTSATCANTYCHGSTLEGSTTPAPPNWTTVDGSQIMCNSCHGDWPELLGASHPFHIAYTCDTCHARVVVAGMMTIRNPDLHIDGKVDVSMAVGTWDPVAKSCADMPSACHSSGSIPW
jgi:predicted CxxxxCH...CXXCH cytochrome family protein